MTKVKCTIDPKRVRRDIEALTLFDDFFMRRFFDGAKAETELVLRILLNNAGICVKRVEDVHIKDVSTEKVLKNLYEHEARLDILATDESGRLFNIEFQVNPRHAEYRRARFYGSMIDSSALKRGEPYTSLPDVYIIFLTLADVVGRGHDIDVFSVFNHQDRESADFGMYYVYVNCASPAGNSELDKLKHDFLCSDPDQMHYPVLGQRMKFIKDKTMEDPYMNSILERYKEEGIQEGKLAGIREGEEKGRKEGRKEGQKEGQKEGISAQRKATILQMLADGFDNARIARYTQASNEEIEAVRQTMHLPQA